MEQFLLQLEQSSLTFWLLFIPFFLLVWFLPAVLAVFFNRKQLKLIALANVPAGMSAIAWFALLVWAVGGQYGEQYGKEFSKKYFARFRKQSEQV